MKRQTTMKAGFVRVDDEILERIKKDFAANGRARVHVGVLGASAGRIVSATDHTPTEMTNAYLGAIHEFGVTGTLLNHPIRAKERASRAQWDQFKNVVNIPARSFLRMPVIIRLPDVLKGTKRDQWQAVLIKKGILGALEILGAYCLEVIHSAFETGGFGGWAPLSKYTIRKKGSAAILIDSGQLRQSITAEVKTS